MSSQDLPKEFLKRLSEVTAKRAKTVIDHILEHGFITTEELKTTYGYDHPPRAARDVRDEGIPLETYSVKNTDGRSIAAYRFGDPTTLRNDRLGGRKAFSKKFKQSLVDLYGLRCAVCLGEFEERYLQIDHRVPYEVAGDSGVGERLSEAYMLLCGSCNRAKSWSCEHCENWQHKKEPEICQTCYWARPDKYSHIALRMVRRLDIIWDEDEVIEYERLYEQATEVNMSVSEFLKALTKQLDG